MIRCFGEERYPQRIPRFKTERAIFCGSENCPVGAVLRLCVFSMLFGQPGFEPGTPSPPDLYANQLRYCPKVLKLIFVNGNHYISGGRFCQQDGRIWFFQLDFYAEMVL